MIKIGGLQKFTLIDYPQKLACTVFLAGCNFRCPFCYSSELVLPEKIENQPKIPERDFFNFLKSKKGLLEGVVICGGEPTIYKDLPDLVKEIKKLEFLVKLDTNGSNPEMLKSLIDNSLIDYVAMDIKAPKEKYIKNIGISEYWGERLLDNIEKSINILKEDKIEYEFRTTVAPDLLEKEDIVKIARWLSPAKKYFIQNFRPEKTLDPEFEKVKPYSQKYLLEVHRIISPFFDACQIR